MRENKNNVIKEKIICYCKKLDITPDFIVFFKEKEIEEGKIYLYWENNCYHFEYHSDEIHRTNQSQSEIDVMYWTMHQIIEDKLLTDAKILDDISKKSKMHLFSRKKILTKKELKNELENDSKIYSYYAMKKLQYFNLIDPFLCERFAIELFYLC